MRDRHATASYRRPIVNVGLVTGPVEAQRAGGAAHERRLPRAHLALQQDDVAGRAASPPARRPRPRSRPRRRWSAGGQLEPLRGVAQAQAHADEQQHGAGQQQDARVEAGVRQRRGRGGRAACAVAASVAGGAAVVGRRAARRVEPDVCGLGDSGCQVAVGWSR